MLRYRCPPPTHPSFSLSLSLYEYRLSQQLNPSPPPHASSPLRNSLYDAELVMDERVGGAHALRLAEELLGEDEVVGAEVLHAGV